MKTLYSLLFCLAGLLPTKNNTQSENLDTNVLVGNWTLDMSPHNKTDNNFAMMEITRIGDNSFEGEFYRKGVQIRSAQINTQLGIIYASLISGDGSGTYNTSFYFKEGVLHGSTHAVDRNFLAVWTAVKTKR
ncbi:MAG: hypothetical protein AAF620_09190 [Bacteroidota bacterium]